MILKIQKQLEETKNIHNINFESLLTDTVYDLINGNEVEYRNEFVSVKIEQVHVEEYQYTIYKVYESDELLMESKVWRESFDVFEKSMKLHFE